MSETLLKFKIDIEKGEHGLFYATSPDFKGLLVAQPTLKKLFAAIPHAMEAILESDRAWDEGKY